MTDKPFVLNGNTWRVVTPLMLLVLTMVNTWSGISLQEVKTAVHDNTDAIKINTERTIETARDVEWLKEKREKDG